MTAHNCNVLPFPGIFIPRRLHLTRKKNSEYRSREYLTEAEVEQLMAAAGRVGRHGHRDATLILLAYRHGLRVTELVKLRWDQIELESRLLHTSRLKQGNPSVQPLREAELSSLRRLQCDYPVMACLFCSERQAPLTADAVRKIVSRAGREAGFSFTVHPHMLRHACGYKLAQEGQDTRAIQDYLGHRNIQHTVRYTQLSHERFNGFWKD